MTTYDALLWLHVTFAALWLGAGVGLGVLSTRVHLGGTIDELRGLVRNVHWMGLRFFTPLSLLTLVFGVWLTIEGDWDFGAMWISGGFLGFALSFVMGAAYLGPTSGKIAALLDESSEHEGKARSMLGRVLWVLRADSLIVLVVVFLMTTKPGS